MNTAFLALGAAFFALGAAAFEQSRMATDDKARKGNRSSGIMFMVAGLIPYLRSA